MPHNLLSGIALRQPAHPTDQQIHLIGYIQYADKNKSKNNR